MLAVHIFTIAQRTLRFGAFPRWLGGVLHAVALAPSSRHSTDLGPHDGPLSWASAVGWHPCSISCRRRWSVPGGCRLLGARARASPRLAASWRCRSSSPSKRCTCAHSACMHATARPGAGSSLVWVLAAGHGGDCRRGARRVPTHASAQLGRWDMCALRWRRSMQGSSRGWSQAMRGESSGNARGSKSVRRKLRAKGKCVFAAI